MTPEGMCRIPCALRIRVSRVIVLRYFELNVSLAAWSSHVAALLLLSVAQYPLANPHAETSKTGVLRAHLGSRDAQMLPCWPFAVFMRSSPPDSKHHLLVAKFCSGMAAFLLPRLPGCKPSNQLQDGKEFFLELWPSLRANDLWC